MNKECELTDQLRLQLLGGLHVGSLRPGARLPSIREVAERSRVDHRLAQRAYRQLEAERLVEIRGRSGVFVARAPDANVQVLDDRHAWLAAVLSDGWKRRISLAEQHNLTRCATLHGLRCVSVESTTDHLVAFSSELASDFGFTVIPVRFTALRNGEPSESDRTRIETELRAADAIATTAFHSAATASLADRCDKPLITISINSAIRDEIAHRIQAGPLQVIVADAGFVERAKPFTKTIPGGSNIEFKLAREFDKTAQPTLPTLFTKAARRELGLPEFHLLSGDVPFIGADSALEICKLIVSRVAADAHAAAGAG